MTRNLMLPSFLRCQSSSFGLVFPSIRIVTFLFSFGIGILRVISGGKLNLGSLMLYVTLNLISFSFFII